jgi:hypothetical protein
LWGSEGWIAEVELGRFDQAIVEVGEPWTDEEDEVAGLQDGEPGLGGDSGDAGVGCERRDVEQLAGPPGTELDEALEGGEILDLENLPHIPLQVGADVILKNLPAAHAPSRLRSGEWTALEVAGW